LLGGGFCDGKTVCLREEDVVELERLLVLGGESAKEVADRIEDGVPIFGGDILEGLEVAVDSVKNELVRTDDSDELNVGCKDEVLLFGGAILDGGQNLGGFCDVVAGFGDRRIDFDEDLGVFVIGFVAADFCDGGIKDALEVLVNREAQDVLVIGVGVGNELVHGNCEVDFVGLIRVLGVGELDAGDGCLDDA